MKKYIILFILLFIKSILNAQVTLNLKLFIEGYYIQSTGKMDNNGLGGCLFVTHMSTDSNDADTIEVGLMDQYSLAEVASQKIILKTDGNATALYPGINSGTKNYIRIKHRNALETWSASAITLNSITAYDFTTASSQAFGNNMSNVGTAGNSTWAFFSGDISDAATASVCVQDCIMEAQDYGDMEDAIYQTLIGYNCQDITGDGRVDSSDYGFEENNVYSTKLCQIPPVTDIEELFSKNNYQFKFKCISLDGNSMRIISAPMHFKHGTLTIYSLDGKIIVETKIISEENINDFLLPGIISSGIYLGILH